MKRFAQLIDQIDQTTKSNDRIKYIVDFLHDVNDEDKLWFVALFSGKRPKGIIKTALIKQWIVELTNLPEWLFEQSYHVVGDLAETIALLAPDEPQKENNEDTLSQIITELNTLRDGDEGIKKQFVINFWSTHSKAENFVFNKLITGGFRIGVSQRTVVKALGKFLDKEDNTISHRLMGNWNPAEISFADLLVSEDANDDNSRPYPFYLSYALEGTIEDLGNPSDWQAEKKWDGIRGQIIKRDGELFVWSRGEELVTDKFPEFNELKENLPDGVVLDGEIIGWKDGAPLPFHDLQTRIGRKTVTKKHLETVPVKLIAYDLLEHNSIDIRNKSTNIRRELLDELVKDNKSGCLLLSDALEFNHWDELKAIRQRARELYCEGLMLKKKNAPYGVGRKKGDWWKWKVDPLTIDAVLIYAMRGHGRRSNLYTDYTFAVWDNEELVTFAKAYSGLTDEEFKEVDKFIKKNTIDRYGPVRSVKAELVFEIAFEGIAKSGRHKSGIAVRFPRMSRWRKDKKAEEANTIEDLHQLLNVYGG